MENRNEHVEDVVLGPLDPTDNDLNNARDAFDELPVDNDAAFVIGYVGAALTRAAEDPWATPVHIRRARAIIVAYGERQAVES